MPWDWNIKISPEKAQKLREYFAQPMLNPTSGSHPNISLPGELNLMQYRWLGYGAEIGIVEQRIEHADIADRSPLYKELGTLERKQSALELLMHAKGISIPDPWIWRNPKLPDGWRERYLQDLENFPRKTQSEMSKNTKSQTGEGAKKGKPKKGRAISPKPVKIKKG